MKFIMLVDKGEIFIDFSIIEEVLKGVFEFRSSILIIVVV